MSAVLAGAIYATIRFFIIARSVDGIDRYKRYRRTLGRGILLGLEFLVAADIIRSVAVAPTLSGVAVLGAIVLIRTFLSITLEVEMNGQWPWQGK
ncbi:MAG: DUF1622 domain-containing protein [Syntrophorhabdus sp.]